jgi:hypothetical protein
MGNGRYASRALRLRARRRSGLVLGLGRDQQRAARALQLRRGCGHGGRVAGALWPRLTLQLVAGLFFPTLAAACGLTYIIGREFYAWGYRAKGPKGRMIGALLLDIALFANVGAAMWGSAQFAGLPALIKAKLG